MAPQSLPDSLPSNRSTSLRKARATSLPPGPPSSSNDQQSVVEQEEEPALALDEDFEPTAAELAAFLADEEVMLEIQEIPQALPDLLGCPPARASPETVADVSVTRQHVAAHRVQEAVRQVPDILGSTPARNYGGGSEREDFHLADHGQVGMTRGQQALYVARRRMQISRTDVEIYQVVHTLALALGATRTDARTRQALLAVLVLLNRPEMSEQEVCASTGASLDNFKRWQRRVLNAQAGLPPPAG